MIIFLNSCNTTNNSCQYIELCQDIFDLLLSSIRKINVYYNEEEKSHEGAYAPESTLFEKIMEILVQTEFKICLNPVAARNAKVWERIELLCKELINNKIAKNGLVHIWKVFILSMTDNLSDALANISLEEFEVFKDPLIIPFEGLSMKSEYRLQVLFNAFGDKCDAKYEKVVQSNLYVNHFETWFKLLQVLKISIEPNNIEILCEYIKGIHLIKYIVIDDVVNKLTYSNKINKSYDTKALLTLFPPPNSTLLVLRNYKD